jgi:hypothetical protein
VFQQIAEEVLFRQHRHERRYELVVVVDASTVVYLVLATFLVLIAQVHVQLE